MNSVQCIGRLVREVELREVGNEQVVLNNCIAIPDHSKKSPQDTDFIPIVAWNGIAKLMSQYLSKGDEIGITGRLRSRSYENKQQQTQYVTEIVINDVTFLRKKQGRQEIEVEIV